nr:helix-turn-helix domain-containing protein [Clostridium sp. Marseille-P7770]
MAKGKYEKWCNDPDKKLLLSGWARDGLTDEEIAKKIGISRSTLAEWKKKYPDISDTLKKGKEIVDTEVENSLLKRAKGYTAKVKKTFKLKKIEYDKTGKKVKEEEVLEVGEDEVHIPADVTAMIFWLKNRLPEKWKDKRFAVSDLADADDAMQTGVILMADIDEEAGSGNQET